MTISTRLTGLLRVEHPIMLAPMDVVADGKLAATVTAAGGFGIIGGGYGNESWLTRELDAAGDARIGVGFITWSMAKNPRLLDIALERKPAADHALVRRREAACRQDQARRRADDLPDPDGRAGEGRDRERRGHSGRAGCEAGGHGVSRGTFALVPAVVDVAAARRWRRPAASRTGAGLRPR